MARATPEASTLVLIGARIVVSLVDGIDAVAGPVYIWPGGGGGSTGGESLSASWSPTTRWKGDGGSAATEKEYVAANAVMVATTRAIAATPVAAATRVPPRSLPLPTME